MLNYWLKPSVSVLIHASFVNNVLFYAAHKIFILSYFTPKSKQAQVISEIILISKLKSVSGLVKLLNQLLVSSIQQ